MSGAENPSFETPGVNPGQADQWSESYSNGASDRCDFTHSDFYTRPEDDFEDSWSSNHLAQTAFGLTDIVACGFDNLSQEFENFETSWWEPHTPTTDPHNGVAYLYYYSGNFATAMFDSLAEEHEDFEEAWGTAPYNQASIYDYASGTFSNANFDVALDAVEDFEEEWKDNENATSHIMSTTSASFDGFVPEFFEDFEEEWFETFP